MTEIYLNGRPIGKVPYFIFKRHGALLNFLHRIFVSGYGEPLIEYLSIFNSHKISGGWCVILINKYIIAFTPFPRLVHYD